MNKKALIILAEGFEEVEAITPIDLLRRAPIEVTVAGLTSQVKGARGVLVTTDKTVDSVTADFDCLILPGGGLGAENLHRSARVNALIKEMDSKGKLIAAICASPGVVLAPTGILKNKSVTGYPGMLENFDASTQYLEQDVVADGRLITSRGPATAFAFALAIIEHLAGKETAEKISKATLFS